MAVTFKEEDQVWHKKHGLGRVALVDDDGVLVEFDGGVEELFETGPRKQPGIVKLGPEGYVLRRKNEPETVDALAETPPELIKLLHKDFGNKISFTDIKQHLCDGPVAKDAWDEWWKKAQPALKDDPRYQLDKSAVNYLGDMVQIADDLLHKFNSARNIKAKQKVCREILQMEEKGVPVDDAKEAAITFFTGTAASTSNNLGARLEALLFLKELDPIQYKMLKQDLYGRIQKLDVQDASDAVAEISDSIIRARLFDIYKELLPDTFIDIATTLTKRFKKTQRDWALDHLLDDQNTSYIQQILDTTLADVPTNTQPFVWFGIKMFEAPDKLLKLGYDDSQIILRFFKLLLDSHITSAFSSNPKDGPSVSREEDEILKFLLKKKQMIKILKKHPEMIVLQFARYYSENKAIRDEDKAEMMKMLRETFPELDFDEALAMIEVQTKDEVVLSREAFDRYETEFQDLVENQLPEISRAIGTAREWGDISENAEYHAAKEKQGLLMSRKRYLERLLETAKIMDED